MCCGFDGKYSLADTIIRIITDTHQRDNFFKRESKIKNILLAPNNIKMGKNYSAKRIGDAINPNMS